MTRREYERLLDQMVKRAHTLLPGGVDGQCIIGTKIAIEVVRQAGGRARALPVKVIAYSPEYARRVDAGRQPDAPGENFLEWRSAGAAGVAIGYGETPLYEAVAADRIDPWDGHLVALVNERYLLDLTIGQVTCRSPLVPAQAFWLEMPREFLTNPRAVAVIRDETYGTRLDYTYDPENTSYLTGAAWCDYAVRYDGQQVSVVDRRPDRVMRRG